MLKKNIENSIMRYGGIFLIFAILAFGVVVVVNASDKEQGESSQVSLNLPSKKMTSSEVTMFVSGARQVDKYFQVDVCYSLPDDRDWLLTSRPDDAVLVINNQSYTLREEGVLDLKFASDGMPYERCQYLLYPVVVKDGSSLVLSIKKVYVSEPDQVDCAMLQKQLDDAGSQIKIECPTKIGMGGFVVVEKPATMTSKFAQDIAFDLLTDARLGPWVFQIAFKTP